MAGTPDPSRSIDTLLDRPRATIPRLVAVDVDGTLLTSAHQVSDATVAEVARVRARGVEVLLASSRGPGALWPVLRVLGLTAPAAFVASQGGLTGRYSAAGALEVLDRRPMPLDLVRPVLQSARRAGVAVSWYSGPSWFVSHVDHTIAREARVVGVEPVVRQLDDVRDEPEKIMLIAPSADLAPLRAIAGALPDGLCAQVSNPTYLEITRDDVDKAHATAEYLTTRGIDPADVVAIGDGPNDLGLLALVGVSVAPASARPEVLAEATFVTTSNDDDAVARALRALVPRDGGAG